MNENIIVLKNPAAAGQLFKGWKETLIYSCLQGVMGQIYADNEDMPESILFAADTWEELKSIAENDVVMEDVVMAIDPIFW